jgi:hypothetical protein
MISHRPQDEQPTTNYKATRRGKIKINAAVVLGGQEALNAYRTCVETLTGGAPPKSASIRGRTFPPAAVMQHADQMVEAVRDVARALVEAAGSTGTVTATAPGQGSDVL